MDNVLVVAFDGMDYELIQDFGLENVCQEEFGKIDNDTGIKSRKTSELFASFITGETSEVHGVEGIKKWRNSSVGKIEDLIISVPLSEKFSGLRNGVYKECGWGKTLYDRSDLDCQTFFESVEDSRALFVPGYNPTDFQDKCGVFDDVLGSWRKYELPYRRRELFNELENDVLDARDLLMVHFHFVDMFQHSYGDEEINFDRRKLLKVYKEFDRLAGEIVEKAEAQGYDTIIFMSDHGLPEGLSHNKNAFYSCNRELFGSETPHITDFHSKICEVSF